MHESQNLAQYPTVTTAQMREVDRRAIEDIGIPSAILMEQAGIEIARHVMKMLDNGEVLCLAGSGNNGGDGFVAARHLHNQGIGVRVFFSSDPSRMSQETRTNFDILPCLNIPVTSNLEHALKAPTSLVLDALIGVGLTGTLRAKTQEIINKVNQADLTVVAADTPSGLNCDTGEILGTAIHASLTVTIGLPKRGFFLGKGPAITGELVLAPIFPPEAWSFLSDA